MPHIDGLRAIAVLSVIFYHLNIQSFQGGFVGVDVFFVISGYLISKIIYQGLNSGTFSISVFYVRRAKRNQPSWLRFSLLRYSPRFLCTHRSSQVSQSRLLQPLYFPRTFTTF
ncbi:acyltransferase family protein [Pseudomonas sp. NPDC090203]|uniref:acyltransferase family protein n=1 Tax=Pseudomonas sp. NPDC090203 TaxID=3364477 RepID=UPI003807F80D